VLDPSAERWAVAKATFTEALECPTGERSDFLNTACGGDASLRAEVESLLAAHAGSDDFLNDAARERLRADVTHAIGLEPGARLGAYRVIREIARGGMGTVYLAERADAEYEQQVAIKLVTRGMDTEMVLHRFRRERQILAELQHPNIARLLEGGTTPDGLPYFVMEYIDGEPIDRYCASRQLSTGARLDLFRDVCAAVQYAHQRLVVHRDIKPGNILVTADGIPKLLDFGIAKLLTPSEGITDLTAPQFRVMTPDYASPEQLHGSSVTTLADVYSLGVVLYQLLTGAHPGKASGTGEAIPPSRLVPAFRGDVDTIVLSAIRRDPERRYASVQAFSDDIGRYQRGLPVAARADSWSYRALKFVRRNRAAVGLGVLSLVAVVGGSAAFAWQAHVANAHRVVAERRFTDVRRLALSLLFDVHDSIANLSGSTRARQLIVTRSLEALDTLAIDDANDPALRRDIAAAYLRVGDVQGLPYSANLGQTSAALVSYGHAARLLEPIVAEDSADVRAQFDLTRAYMKMGAIHMRAREWSAAVADERRAVAVAERAVARAPSDTSLQAGLSDALIYLGDAYGVDDRRTLAGIGAARAAYTKALDIRLARLQHAPRTSALIRSIGVAYTRLGYIGNWTVELTGDTTQFAISVANFRSAQAMRHEAVAADSSSPSLRRLADGWMDVALAEVPLGHLQNALAVIDSAGPIFVALGADAANAEALRDLAYFAENRGVVLVLLKRAVEAEAEERAAIGRLLRLQRQDPASLEEFYHLVHAEETLSDALALDGKLSMALASYDDARKTLRRWQAAEPSAAQPARLAVEIDRRVAGLGGR
jgi:non-specific serine/threonine protein kinase/serine/threonine-protein kinase